MFNQPTWQTWFPQTRPDNDQDPVFPVACILTEEKKAKMNYSFSQTGEEGSRPWLHNFKTP